MIPKELFQKVKRIEITTRRLVSDIFAGQYHSVFKGQGIEFDEVREYQIGDDIRTIDWNVTARTGKPHVKKFVEERELTIMILVDLSSSCRFSSVKQLKSQLAAEISAVLALSAVKNNDKVGLILFTDKIEKFIPPRKGRQHVLRVIREVLYFEPQNKGTNIVQALEYLNKVTTRKTISFLISDFYENLQDDPAGIGDGLKKTLSVVNKRHDMIAIALNDPREFTLPEINVALLEDLESGDLKYVDSSNKKLLKEYLDDNMLRLKKRDKLFRTLGIDHIDISTDSSYADELVKFFMKRRKRRL